jgi:hypothetical protein
MAMRKADLPFLCVSPMAPLGYWACFDPTGLKMPVGFFQPFFQPRQGPLATVISSLRIQYRTSKETLIVHTATYLADWQIEVPGMVDHGAPRDEVSKDIRFQVMLDECCHGILKSIRNESPFFPILICINVLMNIVRLVLHTANVPCWDQTGW